MAVLAEQVFNPDHLVVADALRAQDQRNPRDGGRFSSATKALGFASVRFHVLQHIAISVLIKSGTHPKVVQEFAGHHSSAFTMDCYGHVTPSLQREIAERV